jgi:hypothetical protein
MRWAILGSCVFVCVAASTALASSPPVPLTVQREIQQRVKPIYTWTPTFAPVGDRYARWGRASNGNGLSIFFNRRGGPTDDLIFNVAANGSCAKNFGRPMKTFVFGGVKVHWSATYEDQQAWRCLKSPTGTPFAIWASQNHPGADDPRSHWAVDLAQVVASAKPNR